MLPIVLNPKSLRVGLAGLGESFAHRRALLVEAGVRPAVIFEDSLPSPGEIAGFNLLFVAGLDETVSGALAKSARAAGVLVNVEDRPALCDFHVPALIRRGDLLLTISTGGRSPALAKALREDIERRFGTEWDSRLVEIAVLRETLRSEGVDPGEVSERTRALIQGKGWLD